MSHLATALLHFQADPPPVHLDATNPHFGSKFASLAGVVAAVRPALNKHGLVVTQLPSVTPDGAPALETRLIHAESGEVIASTMPLMAERAGPQAQGSALTYARRYALLSILGLVGDEDDDAEASSNGDVHSLKSSRADAVEPGQMIVNWGKKYKGKTVAEVPSDYWNYCLENDYKLPDDLRAAVELHLGLTAQPVGVKDELDDIPF